MKKSCLFGVILSIVLTGVALAQKAEPKAEQKAQEHKDDVVRISVTLVQVDAVVTDDKGKQVTDLKPQDFQILEDGRPQRITNFSYISNVSARPAEPAGLPDKLAPPIPSKLLHPDEVKRTIALVVDDLSMSFESIAYARYALKKYVDEQMQPGDLVAILRTGAGIGALQQFTTDKRQLYAAIERLHWNSMGVGGIGAFGPISSSGLGGGMG